MTKPPKRYMATGTHAGKEYEITIEQPDDGGFVVADVYIEGLPLKLGSAQSYERLADAFEAGRIIARDMLGG